MKIKLINKDAYFMEQKQNIQKVLNLAYRHYCAPIGTVSAEYVTFNQVLHEST